MRRRPAIIAYDVSCNKRRRRLFRCLQGWSLESQYSLFECNLTTREAEELFLQLTELLDGDEDKLMLAWVDSRREAKAVTKKARIGFRMPALYAG